MVVNERTLRLEQELVDHVTMISQVNEMSINAFIVEAIEAKVIETELSDEYKEMAAAWMNKLNRIASEEYGTHPPTS